MRRQMTATVAVAVLLGTLVTGCGSSPPANPGATDSPPIVTSAATTSETPTPTPTPSVEADPDKAAVVKAYLGFSAAVAEAARHPSQIGHPKSADYAEYSFDPARAETDASIQMLAQSGLELRGTPPVPSPMLLSLDLTTKPYPTAVLVDCSDSDDWKPYVVKSGKPQMVPTITPAPPYETTTTMIFHRKRWGVYKVSSDTSRTCQP